MPSSFFALTCPGQLDHSALEKLQKQHPKKKNKDCLCLSPSIPCTVYFKMPGDTIWVKTKQTIGSKAKNLHVKLATILCLYLLPIMRFQVRALWKSVPTSSATGQGMRWMECVMKNCARHTPFIQMLYIGLVDNAWLQSVFPKPNPAKLLFWCSTLFFSCQIKSGNGESWIAYGPADREREYETKPRVQLA